MTTCRAARHCDRGAGGRAQGIEGLVDLSVEQQTDIPTVRVNFDRAALGRYGLQSGTAAEALETALVGREVGQILVGQIAVPLVVRYPQGDSPTWRPFVTRRCARPSGGRIP